VLIAERILIIKYMAIALSQSPCAVFRSAAIEIKLFLNRPALPVEPDIALMRYSPVKTITVKIPFN